MTSANRNKYDMLGGADSVGPSFIKMYYRACSVDLHTKCIKFLGVSSRRLQILKVFDDGG
jgi:hypothetical protein